MWIVRLALRRPYTFVVMALAIILLTPVVLLRTPVDIFPDINIPVISLVWTYNGLQPQEMEQRITSNVERGVTTLVSDVEHIESQSLNGIAVIKVFFQPGANIQTALAQTAAISQTFLRFLPPGTTPPLVIIYSASTVPVIQIGLTSDTLSEQQLFDFGNYFIRTQLATVPGAGTPSTIDIVDRVKQMLDFNKGSIPEGMRISTFFDQSLYVRASIQGVIREAIIAACLTAVMILLFLGNWKSTLIIAISIPLSILVSILCLSALGQTINIMTLGGLALAVGILVDDATVEIENINRNLAMGKETVQAILDGAQQIAVPAFVSTLCICIVFIPMFFLSGVAKFLFVPLAEAVSFAMLASYMWSRTIVPTLAMYLLSSEDEYQAEEHAGEKMGFFRRYQQGFERSFERFREGYRRALDVALHSPKLFSACFLAFCVLSVMLVGVLGRDFFPKVDAGQIRLHLRARTGLRIEETARLADQVNGVIRETIPKDELTTVLDNIGVPYSGINLTYSNAGTIGTSDAEILVV